MSAIEYIANEYGLDFSLIKDIENENRKPKEFKSPSEFRNFCFNESRRNRAKEFSQQLGENIYTIDWTNGIGESDDVNVEWASSGVTAQGILIGLLRKIDFEFHKAEPPNLKKIEEWLDRCRNHMGTNSDTPTLFLCDKQPEAWQEYFELAYEKTEQKYLFQQKDDFEMRCGDSKGKVYFSTCMDAYEVSGETIPDGITLIVHRERIFGKMQWVVSEGSTGVRLPDTQVFGETPSDAIDSALKLIEKNGIMKVFTAISLISNG